MSVTMSVYVGPYVRMRKADNEKVIRELVESEEQLFIVDNEEDETTRYLLPNVSFPTTPPDRPRSIDRFDGQVEISGFDLEKEVSSFREAFAEVLSAVHLYTEFEIRWGVVNYWM